MLVTGVIDLRENPSTISSLVLLLGLISRFPTNELRVATSAQKRLRIDYDSVKMSRNALEIWYESGTIFQIGELVAKVLNSSNLLSRIPDRPTNCKNSLRTANQLRSSQTEYDSAKKSNICQLGACVELGYKSIRNNLKWLRVCTKICYFRKWYHKIKGSQTSMSRNAR